MKNFITLFLIAGCASFTSAQFQFDLIGSIPTGDFADDSGRDDDGFATFGFGGSFAYSFQTGVEGLSIVPSVGFIFNPSDLAEEGEDNARELFAQNNIQGGSFSNEGGSYLSVPITIGPSYRTPISDGLDFFATGHLGLGLNFISDTEISGDAPNIEYAVTVEYNSPVTFVGGIESGIFINDRWKLGLAFLSFGEPEFEVDVTESANGTENQGSFDTESPRAMFLLKVGFTL